MTHQEILAAYQLAYKQAGMPPVATMANAPIKPVNPLSRFNNFKQLPIKANSGQQRNGNAFTRTWEAGSMNDYTNPINASTRQTAQNLGIGDLTSALEHKVSPLVVDSYNPNNKPFNMSREAMVRRINMLRRQQELDNRINNPIAGK